MDELQNKIEAILFASGKGVTEEDLAKFCEEKPNKIKKSLTKLSEKYQTMDGSLIISKHKDKWKLTVKGRYTQYIEKIVSETELPKTILKTLSLIAYKSPVLQSDIINMRGQSAYEHIKELVKEKLITKEESGRSYLLKITDKFYNYFDVEGDDEIRELFENLRKQQQKITELEIINIAKEQEEKEKKLLGNLEVVDSDGNSKNYNQEEKIEPVRNEKTEEEIKAEKSFLKSIDSKIEELSKRVTKHELPKKQNEEEIEKKDKISSKNETKKEEENSEKESEEPKDYI